MALPEQFVEVRVRARPMAPDERRAAILDAVIPLLRERGRGVPTQELAAAAGVAEGTLFRAFGDKEALLDAAIERHFDPTPFRDRLRAIDPQAPTELKVRELVTALCDRFTGVIGFMTAMRLPSGPPPHRAPREDWVPIVDGLFRPDELAVPTEILAYWVRLIAFGAAIPSFNEAHVFTPEQLADLILRGVLAAPTPEED